jgi:hypothetical protein
LPGLPGIDLQAGSSDCLRDFDAGEVHLAGGFLLTLVGLGGGVTDGEDLVALCLTFELEGAGTGGRFDDGVLASLQVLVEGHCRIYCVRVSAYRRQLVHL